MTDFRALCEELLEAANTLLGQGESPANPGERLILTVHLENLEDCANRARAALAEQPVGPTVPNLDCDEIEVPAYYRGDEFHAYRHGFASGWAKAVTKQPAATPIPVAERLPGPEDCDAEGRCWWFDSGTWILLSFSQGFSWGRITHWLPANALPVPSND
jgi:hypothetical protein